MLEDQHIDEAEEKELFQHLYELTGTRKKKKGTLESLPEVSANVEYNEPIPLIDFENNKFYLLGQFIIGTPERLSEVINEKGGILSDKLTDDVEYCIVGAMAELGGDLSEEVGRQINTFKLDGMKVMTEESWVDLIF